jgi:dipeptidyl aminopeptidase/acylaminoacyl peptidase
MSELKPFETEDLLLEQRIADLHLARRGAEALTAVRHIDKESMRDRMSLWTIPLNGGEPKRLTFGPHLDRSPRWSPDGREIAFLSDRGKDGSVQVCCMSADGGEAQVMSHLSRGADQLYWRPDGKSFLAASRVTVDPDRRSAGCDRTNGADAPEPDPDAPQLVWRLPYKLDGTGYLLDSRLHLFLIDRGDGGASQLTHGDFDVRSAAWAPDGGRICLCRTRSEDGQAYCTDIWLLELDDRGSPSSMRRLTTEQANCGSPSWSPDGRWIAFSGAVDAGDAQMRLWLIDVDAGAVHRLGSESLEVLPTCQLQWNRDSSELASIQVHKGLQHVAAIRVPGGETRCIVAGKRHIAHLVAHDQLVYTSETPARPLELFVTPWSDHGEKQLSHFNQWREARLEPRVELRTFSVPSGGEAGDEEEIEGWLMQPSKPTGKAGPLLVDMHGGPASSVTLQFPAHPYWQILCSRGWSVLALNAVGSSSFGRAFSERLRGRWGELDLPQVLSAIQHLQREGIADDRVAITGGSYGGFFSAYAVGHCDVLRAAVVAAPVANMESHFGTSDSGFFADEYSTRGSPAEHRELLARLSPMSTIERVKTPTLFLQGTADLRCPRGQSEELFVKLRSSGCAPTEMVLYPGGTHTVPSSGKPAHRLDFQRRLVDWLERWIDVPVDQRRLTSRASRGVK